MRVKGLKTEFYDRLNPWEKTQLITLLNLIVMVIAIVAICYAGR